MVLRVCDDSNHPQCSKTAVSILNEKARKFHLKITWNLSDEFGPSHDRTFCVKLTLTCRSQEKIEVFEGVGKSIRAARQVAACVAIDRSVLLKNLVDQKRTKVSTVNPKEIQCLTDFINAVPHPMGPRAELQQLATIFHLSRNFFRLPPLTSPVLPTPAGLTRFPRYDGIHQATLYRVGLDFAGRQYVGEGTTRSTAEQEASAAALKALRRALLSVTKCVERQHRSENQLQTESLGELVLRPDSAVWRLRVIGKLHGENPVFQRVEPSSVQEKESQGSAQKPVITCTCSLKCWGCVQASGSSLKESRERAAELMLARLSCGVPRQADNCNVPPETGSHASVSSRRKLRNRNKWRFACDRAEADYGQELNPIARLHFVCVAKQLPLPVFDVQSDSAAKVNSHGLQGSARTLPPEFTYQVRIATDCVHGPPACNKRLAKRLAAEAMLAHLGFHRSDFTSGLQSALRHPQSTPQTNVSGFKSSTAPNGSPSKSVTEESKSLTKDSSSDDATDGSPQKDRHVAFSCTRDVLILEEVDGFNWKRFPSSTRRSLRLSTSDAKMKTDRNSSTKPVILCPSRRQRSLWKSHSSSSLTLDNIGHWADSQEAQTVSRSVSLRRSNSCSNVSSNRINPCEASGTDSLHSRPSNTSSSPSTERPVNPALKLLSQLAVFCLLEHGSPHQTAVKRPTVQLTSLCQRLHIPCQFTDQPPKFDWDKRLTQDSPIGPELYHHRTVLTIGAVPNRLTPVTQHSPNANRPTPLVVRGSGRTKDAAHDDAVIAAFRQLVQLTADNTAKSASED